jgi:hypothetical protein
VQPVRQPDRPKKAERDGQPDRSGDRSAYYRVNHADRLIDRRCSLFPIHLPQRIGARWLQLGCGYLVCRLEYLFSSFRNCPAGAGG